MNKKKISYTDLLEVKKFSYFSGKGYEERSDSGTGKRAFAAAQGFGLSDDRLLERGEGW